MAKLKSSLVNMLVSLTLICIVSGTVLSTVHDLTFEAIAHSKQLKLENALSEILPPFDNNPVTESYKMPVEGDSVTVYPAKKEDKLVGIAIESNSMKGFSGEIKIILGIEPDGKIIDYAVLSHLETPGLGDKMDPWFKTDKNKQSIIGLNLSEGLLSVTKDGGEVDAITAATITSRAFLDAVNRAYAGYSGNTDAVTGATGDVSGTDIESGATSDSSKDGTTAATSGSSSQTDRSSEATSTSSETDGITEASSSSNGTENTPVNKEETNKEEADGSSSATSSQE